jgi:hypothetical protein
LQHALHIIKRNPQRRVCGSIHEAADASTSKDRIFCHTYLHKWVNSMLAPHFFLERWLQEQRPDITLTHPAQHPEEVRLKLQDVRLRWINWMINELIDDQVSTVLDSTLHMTDAEYAQYVEAQRICAPLITERRKA